VDTEKLRAKIVTTAKKSLHSYTESIAALQGFNAKAAESYHQLKAVVLAKQTSMKKACNVRAVVI
jgi:hypothetical protein